MLISFLTLFGNLYLSLALNNTDYRLLVEQRQENCNDCFRQSSARQCSALYGACPARLSNPGPTDPRGVFYEKFRPTLEVMRDDSSLLRNATESAYCLNFQKKATDISTFCQVDLGTKVFMVAEFLADVAAQAILDETRATSVNTLLVDIQFDMRSQAEYIADVLKDLNKTESSMQQDGTVGPPRLPQTGIPSVTSTAGPNGYRMWSVLVANNPQKNDKDIAIKVAVRRAARKYGKGVYLAKNSRVEQISKNMYIVSLKAAKPCNNVACY